MEQNAKKNFLLELLFALAVIGIIFVALKLLLGYMLPFLVALLVAMTVQKPSRKIAEKTKIKKGITAAFLSAFLFIAAAIAVMLIFYSVSLAVKSFADDLPRLLNGLKNAVLLFEEYFLSSAKENSPELYEFLSNALDDGLQNLASRLTGAISSKAANFAKSLPSFLFSILAALVASCYIAKDYDGLKAFFKSLCTEKIYRNIIKIKGIITGSILKLLRGYFFLMLITFSLLIIGFWIIGIKHTVVLSLIVAFVDILPVFGTGTVLLPWGIYELISKNGLRGIGIIALYAVITIVRNFSEPKIIGGQIGINPLFMLISMFVGLRLFGVFGLIAFPIALITVIKFYKADMEENK